MICIVTAGPTYEPLDKVRRLTNFSTGALGAQLAAFLTGRGHEVTLMMSATASYRGELKAKTIQYFSTGEDLRQILRDQARNWAEAVPPARRAPAIFHAAAVGDFKFGKLWRRTETGELKEVTEGKVSTRGGQLLAELWPTPKILSELREWFPKATIVGWKYEVDGTREDVIERAKRQLKESRTDACVGNGPAYGERFGIVRADGEWTHFAAKDELFEALERIGEPA